MGGFLLVRVLFLTCLFCFIQPSFAFLWMFLKVEIHSNNVTWHKAGKCQSWTVSVSSCLIFTWNSSPEEVCGGTGQDTALHHPDGCNFGLIFFSLVPRSFILFFLLIHRNKREGKKWLFLYFIYHIASFSSIQSTGPGTGERIISHILFFSHFFEHWLYSLISYMKSRGAFHPFYLPSAWGSSHCAKHIHLGVIGLSGEIWVQLGLKCWHSFLLYGLFIYLFIFSGKEKVSKGMASQNHQGKNIVNKYCFPKPVISYRKNLWKLLGRCLYIQHTVF